MSAPRNSRAARKRARLGVAAALALALGCATPPSAPPWSEPQVLRAWPAPPDPPRVRYLGTIRSPADLGRRPGLMERLIGLILGREDAALVKPVSLAKNDAGLLVVADPSVPTVHFIDLEARTHRSLDPDLASQLRSPVGVAVDAAGRAYVSDSVRGEVFVFDGPGRLAGRWGADLLERPTGLALDAASEQLYVVDTLACRVVVFDRAGAEVRRFGRRGRAPGEFNFPTYIAIARDGSLGISDSLNFRVQLLASDGTPIRVFGRAGDGAGDFARPKGVATDAAGRLYVVDAGFENVQIFNPRGELLLAFGAPGTGPGELYLPGGIFLDSSNTIWVADSFNSRVQVFELLGQDR